MVRLGAGRLELACASIDATPPAGSSVSGDTGLAGAIAIESRLFTRVCIIRQGNLRIAITNSDHPSPSDLRKKVAAEWDLPLQQVITTGTGNLCYAAGFDQPAVDTTNGHGSWLTKFNRDLDNAIQSLPQQCRPVHLGWGVTEQPSITYNAKGRLKTGEAIYLDEASRTALKRGYKGEIDSAVTVLRFDDDSGAPALLMTHFTGRPLVSYTPANPVISSDYCGVAMEHLERSFAPLRPNTMFLQGCAGDVNIKFGGAGGKKCREIGRKLGKSMMEAALGEHVVERPTLGFAETSASIRFAPLPSLEDLQSELAIIEDFLRRVDAGAQRLLTYRLGDGMTIDQRRALGTQALAWTKWAIEHVCNGSRVPQRDVRLPVQVVTLSRDIALVFLPGEPFVGVASLIRERSPFAVTIPVSLTDHPSPGPIPQGKDLDDGDQLSAAYRFAGRPQFAKPAGDMLAFKALELLNEMKDEILRGSR